MNNCLNCLQLTSNKKYCSLSCRTIFVNKNFPKKNSRRQSFCICGSVVYLSKNMQQKFCSNSCHQNDVYKKYIELWLAGQVAGCQKDRASNFVRRYLLEKQKGECLKCSNSSWMGQPMPLELEHVDGNYMNNTPQNVCLLCPNCHAQTQTYGSKNKGKGRANRSKSDKERLVLVKSALNILKS